MIILGIETSCDETACAVVQEKNKKFKLLSSIISSQISIHKKYGGVVPEVAARLHVTHMIPILEEALKNAKIKPEKLDAVAVTAGPGLVTSLLVGLQTAKTLSYTWNKPLIAVNHMEGHIMANVLSSGLEKIKFPALCLTISGGHTELVLINKIGHYKIIGQTRDDAVGEAFDKVSKILDLGYPGGPVVSKYAENSKSPIDFPRPMINSNNLDFSFSGIKTAVLYKVREMEKKAKLSKKDKENITCGFEDAVTEVLISKTIRAAKKFGVKTIMIGGGVSANKKIRDQLGKKIKKNLNKTAYLKPKLEFTTDNAAMIATAGIFHAKQKNFIKIDKIRANPVWEIDEKF